MAKLFFTFRYDESLVEKLRMLAKKWATAPSSELEAITADEFNSLTSDEKVKVLDCIETSETLFTERVALMEQKYQLSASGNCEVRFSFLLIALKAKWSPILPKVLEFITEVGRMKYVKPIYKKLFSWEESRQQALDTFAKNEKFMHPITVIVVKSLLK